MKRWMFAALLFGLSKQALALCLAPLCSCSVSATPVAFGAFNPLSSIARNGVGSVTMNCRAPLGLLVPYNLRLTAGSSNSYANRTMTSSTVGSGPMFYNLYTDAAYTSVWGDGTGGTSIISSSFALALVSTFSITYNVHGRINAGQNTLVPGIYTDTVTVTLTYY